MNHRAPADAMRLARDIYDREIRDEAERVHHGQFVAIDVDSRRWRFADSELAAARALRAEVPEAVDVCVLRVGYRAAVSLGGDNLRFGS
jgi:hypothetical protein